MTGLFSRALLKDTPPLKAPPPDPQLKAHPPHLAIPLKAPSPHPQTPLKAEGCTTLKAASTLKAAPTLKAPPPHKPGRVCGPCYHARIQVAVLVMSDPPPPALKAAPPPPALKAAPPLGDPRWLQPLGDQQRI